MTGPIGEMTRVLVVDDSSIVRTLVGTMLRTLPDIVIVQAADGADALTKLDGVRLVVTDLSMPGMDGRELIEKLRADPAHAKLPIIVLTTRSHEEDARGVGADAFVAKPLERTSLVDAVRRLLRR